MKSRQTGFTMIELIIVIVILGILAAIALPKFINMREDAEQATVDGFAGAAASAMNLNYSGCALKNNVPTTDKCVTINACSGVGPLLQGGLPAGYAAAASGAAIGTTNGTNGLCTMTKTVGTATYTASFTGISAGN